MYDATMIFVPGLGGSGPDHWQTLWQPAFDDALRVEQADWNKPERAQWIAALVVWAIRDGRDAAASIDRYIQHKAAALSAAVAVAAE